MEQGLCAVSALHSSVYIILLGLLILLWDYQRVQDASKHTTTDKGGSTAYVQAYDPSAIGAESY